ncbi:MAG: hypothetical protein QM773_01445 [Hyphomonadaceae bacterium]
MDTKASEIRLLVIGDPGVQWLQPIRADGFDSVYPDIGISDRGVAAITWWDKRDGNDEVYLGTMLTSDLYNGHALPERRITHTQASSIGAYLSWNGDQLALVWCDSEEGQSELYAQFFGSGGEEQGLIRRLTNTPTQSSIPSIRPWNSGFLVAWNEYQANDSDGTHHSIDRSYGSTALIEP